MRQFLVLGCALLVAACVASGAVHRTARERALREAATGAGAQLSAGMESSLLAEVPGGTFGPYLGQAGKHRLMVWAIPHAEGHSWVGTAVDDRGHALGEPLSIAEVTGALGLVTLRAEASGGFVLAWTERDSTSEALRVLRLGVDGLRRGPVLEVARVLRPVLWVDVEPTSDATVLLWAEQGAGEAQLRSRTMDRDGKLSGPRQLLDHVIGWQASPRRGGIALGAVEKSAQPGTGPVVVVLLGPGGETVGERLIVSSLPTARPDVDLAGISGSIVLAWSDVRDAESALYVAAVDGQGAVVRQPSRAIRGVGTEALVRLVPPAPGAQYATIVWERVNERPADRRVVRLARIDGQAQLGSQQADLVIHSTTELPELAATKDGIAALTLAPPCARGRGNACPANPVPFFVALGPQLQLREAAPLGLAALQGQAAVAAWGLVCERGPDCMVVAALPKDPAPVYAVRLAGSKDEWRAPVSPVSPPQPPLPLSRRVVVELSPLSEVALAPLGESAQVAAWLTYFPPDTPYERPNKPAPDGRFAPVRALLQVARVAEGEASTPNTISYRARSLGSVAASALPEQGEVLLAWSAIDGGQPQVFLTLLDHRGQKVTQRMLTRSPGEVTDLALARVSDGWVVGWVDERNEDPEVYLAKVDRALQRRGEEVRLTSAPGSPTDLELLPIEGAVLAAWAEARDPVHPGWADIYLARVRAEDGQALAEPHRLASSHAYSHAPRLGKLGQSVVVAWLEGSAEEGSPPPGVLLAELDREGRCSGPPHRVVIPKSSPESLSLDCVSGRCRVVVGSDSGDHAALWGFSWRPGADVTPQVLTVLRGAAGQVSPVSLLGSTLLFAEHPDSKTGRVQLLEIEW